MKYFTVDLYDYFGVERNGNAGGSLRVYLHENYPELNMNRRYPAMLVLPGGGYAMVSEREAAPIAERYFSYGYNAFILTYSVVPSRYPTQLVEAAMAMAYIRRNAACHFTDADHVAAIGFSAGGHLCGSLATMFADEVIGQYVDLSAEEIRPSAAVLSYAVINPQEGLSGGTFSNLCGGNDEILPLVTIDERVTENTPPLFIWHTFNDGCVDVSNAIKIAAAARANNVPFAMHIFGSGQHGLSTADGDVYSTAAMPQNVSKGVENWLKMSIDWLAENGFGYKE